MLLSKDDDMHVQATKERTEKLLAFQRDQL